MYYGNIVSQYGVFYEKRGFRIGAVEKSLPSSIYWVIFVGLSIYMIMSWQLKIENRPVELSISILSGIVVGALLFVIVAMNNPFRGEFCVSSEPYSYLRNVLLK
jgi:hypothetical protein